MTAVERPAFDHIALTVPNLDAQVERLTDALGMTVQMRTEHFAVLVDPKDPHRQDFAGMDTSYLRQPGGVEVSMNCRPVHAISTPSITSSSTQVTLRAGSGS